MKTTTRLIDADMCIAKIKDMPVTYDSETVQRCIEVVSNAPTIDAVPRWIPCSERLPEENRTVIASTEYVVFPEARYTKEDGWEWAYESGADYWERIAEVKAWMPLPKPYEVEE